ncbi:MAG: hypothetical protein Cpurp_08990 [Chlorogloea purpurea SAG 13.99]|nr:hypothetical protein [Chlorogloea purpurea SAG 13.99]
MTILINHHIYYRQAKVSPYEIVQRQLIFMVLRWNFPRLSGLAGLRLPIKIYLQVIFLVFFRCNTLP